MVTYFENLTVELYILFVLNTHTILCQLDFIYYLIYKLIFYASFWITKTWDFNIWIITWLYIDFWSFENFANMESIRRKCIWTVDLSKFTFDKKILCEVVAIGYNQVYCQILSLLVQCFSLFSTWNSKSNISMFNPK